MVEAQYKAPSSQELLKKQAQPFCNTSTAMFLLPRWMNVKGRKTKKTKRHNPTSKSARKSTRDVSTPLALKVLYCTDLCLHLLALWTSHPCEVGSKCAVLEVLTATGGKGGLSVCIS